MALLSRDVVIVGACFAVIVALMMTARPARSADHHPLHKDFYRTWQRPDGMGSCCNARIVHPNGGETGDCEPTETRLIGGRWYARLPHAGAFIEVPDSKIIREKNPTQGGTDGHLCWTEASGIMCFVPPFGGG